MTHIRTISRLPRTAQDFGRVTAIETVILLLMAQLFSSWDNFQTVISNLQKYFSKTP